MDSIRLVRTNNSDPDFIALVDKLNAELAVYDGEDHAFYHQYNGLDDIKHILVAYLGDLPIGCGAMKPLAILRWKSKECIPQKVIEIKA